LSASDKDFVFVSSNPYAGASPVYCEIPLGIGPCSPSLPEELTADAYQKGAVSTAIYSDDIKLTYPALGLAGEAGEVADKVADAIFPEGPPPDWDEVSYTLRMIYNALRAAGRAGRECEHIKKLLRDKQGTIPAGVLDELRQRFELVTAEQASAIASEDADVAWYVANVADDLGRSLSSVLQGNLDKLADRKARGVLSGSGDNR
jgi:NTP pyrophosphatase (non-canonical NTP hydrolase)